MAIGWLSSVKFMLLSTGILSTAVVLKLTLPLVVETISDLPLLWSVMISWFRPPYLYLVINCIILTIVASSKLGPGKSTENEEADSSSLQKPPVKVEVGSSLYGEEDRDKPVEGVVLSSPVVFGYVDSPLVRKQRSSLVEMQLESTQENDKDIENGDDFAISRGKRTPLERENLMEIGDCSVSMEKPPAEDVCDDDGYGDKFVISSSETTLLKEESPTGLANSTEKPLTSARLGRRKSIKSGPRGKVASGVSRPRRDDMLEETWRNRKEGRQVPLRRHLRKSDTRETLSRGTMDDTSTQVHAMRKAETFNDRSPPSTSPGSGRLRREPSLSKDELNRRVEAFINKFNEEIRLERRGSMHQDWSMIDTSTQVHAVRKAETFNDRSPPSTSPGSGRPRREPWLSKDELNRRVEAFINKFNEDREKGVDASGLEYD